MNGNIVTGDGETVIERSSVVIQDEYIKEVSKTPYVYDNAASKVIDAEGGYIIPGVINHHIHGVTFGPAGPSAGRPRPRERVIDNLNKLMLQGTTTVLNSDGFATMEEVEAANKLHPVNIRTGTTHAPVNFRAAELAAGQGLEERHKKLTVEHQLRLGAVAIAEIGGGDTLGGGATDYLWIPKAIKEKTGVSTIPSQAKALKEAVLSRHIKRGVFNPTKTGEALKDMGLDEKLTVEEAKTLIEDIVLSSYDTGIGGIEEAAVLAEKYDVPTEVHNASGSMDAVYKAALKIKNKLIAGHSNHPSFELKEGVEHARRLKECGAVVDVSTLDIFGAKQ
ncbi:MAG: amidohydrolase, partial [Nitrososphaeria archaeon]|nr:amidohydrolase [Nitrososphaeria archaeon]